MRGCCSALASFSAQSMCLLCCCSAGKVMGHSAINHAPTLVAEYWYGHVPTVPTQFYALDLEAERDSQTEAGGKPA